MTTLTKQNVETVSISTSLGEKGLCSTCAQAAGCVYLKAGHRPVWYCEEFDEVTAVASGFTAPTPAIPKTNGNGNGHAGLCVNCDVRKECVLRNAGQAVLECEEYT